jgi:hypothetical protein
VFEFIMDDDMDDDDGDDVLEPLDYRWMCLNLAAANRVEGEDWVETAKKAHAFLRSEDGGNVRDLRPVS